MATYQQSRTIKQSYPMQRLPSELINEIFSLTLPGIPSFKPAESPLLLTTVCSTWRELAISQSSLWDTIYLPSPNQGILSSGFIQLCHLWLKRSGNRSLSIDFHLSSDYQPLDITEAHQVAVHKVVKLLVPYAHRIFKLLRISPQFLLGDLQLKNMTILDDLFLCDTANDRTGKIAVPFGSFQVPPTLRCLSLRQTFFDLRAFSSFNQIAHLDLWQLQGDGSMSIGTCLQVLRSMPWLESCTMDIAQAQNNCKLSDLGKSFIHMPNLTFLFISWDWIVDVGPILDVLYTPILKRLGLRGPPPPSPQQWSNLLHFLLRCKPQLTQLSLKEIGYTDIQLLECLKLLPSITNLSISQCPVDTFFIKALAANPKKLCAKKEIVLPSLEYLSLESCDNFEIKDLISMLQSRGKGSPLPLKAVRLMLCQKIADSTKTELENCGVESMIIRVGKVAGRASSHRL